MHDAIVDVDRGRQDADGTHNPNLWFAYQPSAKDTECYPQSSRYYEKGGHKLDIDCQPTNQSSHDSPRPTLGVRPAQNKPPEGYDHQDHQYIRLERSAGDCGERQEQEIGDSSHRPVGRDQIADEQVQENCGSQPEDRCVETCDPELNTGEAIRKGNQTLENFGLDFRPALPLLNRHLALPIRQRARSLVVHSACLQGAQQLPRGMKIEG